MKPHTEKRQIGMETGHFKLSDYDYELPGELIAQFPIEKRDESRLLVLHKDHFAIEHRRFLDIIDYLERGDVLILNDTKVFAARITGAKSTGGKVEALVVKEIEDGTWEMLLRSNSRLKENDILYFDDNSVQGRIISRCNDGGWTVEFKDGKEIKDVITTTGRMPLPPYIKRNNANDALNKQDFKRYQTVYAKNAGAIAAPTAGLHFTDKILEKISAKGIKLTRITLHVGLGTFEKIKEEDIRKHKMHKEFYTFTKETADIIKQAKSSGKKIVATGTTTCRALETIAKNGAIKEGGGWTDIFIYPPYRFQLTDSLITNFHQPGTSLILLVSAFAGRENIISAYSEAIKHEYRFYSYGDCMLII